MKKFLGFMGAAALLTLGSCANENFDGPEAPAQSQGDLYMSMVIDMEKAVGTRTATPDQGVEIGKERENTITNAMILFVSDGKVIYKASLDGNDLSRDPNSNLYNATFAVTRSDLLNDINSEATKQKEYEIYVIANPGTEITYEVQDDIQKTFSLNADADTYWSMTRSNFLMSNAKYARKTISAEDIKIGTHTTAVEAFELGEVELQRAMSRFDIYTDDDHIEFKIVNGAQDADGADQETATTDVNDVTVTIDGVAMVNQATSAYIFKPTSQRKGEANTTEEADETFQRQQYDAFMLAPKTLFNAETKYNYVFSPVQEAFTLPLFKDNSGNTTVANGKITTTTYDYSTLNFTSINTIKRQEEDNTYTYPTTQNPANEGTYHIWRYAMENTNFGIGDNDQIHGNTTGLVFRAKMTGTKFDGTSRVYAYGNVILGNANDLKTYATSTKSDKDDAGVYEVVKIAYNDAVNKAKAKWAEDNQEQAAQGEEWDGENNGTLADLDQYLVKDNHFTIYEPDAQQNYYCYYTYWNRHNDNGKNTEIGQMEFATVRNNVYKILVNTVVRLGHPGKPDDDPDPDDPGTPDEKDSFYCSIICKVLPWEVRMNSLDF